MKISAGLFLYTLILAAPVLAAPGLGVRAQSFGGAYRAVANSNDTLFYNPAGLIKKRRLGADFDYMRDANLHRHRIGFSLIDSKTTDWGMGIAYNAGLSKQDDFATDHLVALGVAMPILSDMIALGTTFNYINDKSIGPKPFEHFFNMDFGILFATDVGLSFALVLDHFLKPKGHEEPMGLAFAGAIELPVLPLTLAFDWSMHDVATLDALSHSMGAGAEFVAMSLIPLRVGFRSDQANDGNYISLGSGVLAGKFSFDALYQQHLSIGKYRNFGLAFRTSI